MQAIKFCHQNELLTTFHSWIILCFGLQADSHWDKLTIYTFLKIFEWIQYSCSPTRVLSINVYVIIIYINWYTSVILFDIIYYFTFSVSFLISITFCDCWLLVVAVVNVFISINKVLINIIIEILNYLINFYSVLGLDQSEPRALGSSLREPRVFDLIADNLAAFPHHINSFLPPGPFYNPWYPTPWNQFHIPHGPFFPHGPISSHGPILPYWQGGPLGPLIRPHFIPSGFPSYHGGPIYRVNTN